MKIGGNIFWATDFLEKSTTTTQGGSGKGGGGEVKTTTYSYSSSFAVGLCEGQISGIGRIWADGKPFDVPGAVWRVYTGTETQLPDPFITAKMGAGSRIVFLGSAIGSLPVTEAELGMPWNWRSGPVGRAAGDAINLSLSFTPQGRGLRTWSPVGIKGNWQGSSDIAISWLRRTRSLAGDSWNAPDVPLGETTETYDIEILNGGGSVVRTVSGLGLAAWTYTAAVQTADFGSLVTSLRVRVFQNGQLGRGAPAEAILNP